MKKHDPEIVDGGGNENLPAKANGVHIWRTEVEKLLPCIFTEAEMKERSASLTRTTLEISRHEEEKKNLTASLTARIKGLKTEQSSLAKELDKGGELRTVKCEAIRDLERNLFLCVRTDTGEIIESRELKDDEKQGRLV